MSNKPKPTEGAQRAAYVLKTALNLEQQASDANGQAVNLDEDANGLMASARVAADKLISDATARADKIRDQAEEHRAQAAYLWNLAARERQAAGLDPADPPPPRPTGEKARQGLAAPAPAGQRFCNGCGAPGLAADSADCPNCQATAKLAADMDPTKLTRLVRGQEGPRS